ncbi:hypothetical protein HYPSUDRAFT_32392 [Hypholoma sublateritium FD-334 SS-4]|uniref:Uncharacterized protein n=1 Tax=Hypholoma sublateritium (strain FD-334 SS-4) TaxID=945553 RepID=A0A0D2PQ55_HYPSF|nr:hypothetical protein HYPSUDRAFT_32392 [Hypholoma sublateritium FD-334 SS-4]
MFRLVPRSKGRFAKIKVVRSCVTELPLASRASQATAQQLPLVPHTYIHHADLLVVGIRILVTSDASPWPNLCPAFHITVPRSKSSCTF